jgi:hypothetical protein
MQFNCIPCLLEKSKEMMFKGNKKQINRIGNKVFPHRYIDLEPGKFIVFRQDLPHQGVGYLLTNARMFMYWDLKGNVFCSMLLNFDLKNEKNSLINLIKDYPVYLTRLRRPKLKLTRLNLEKSLINEGYMFIKMTHNSKEMKMKCEHTQQNLQPQTPRSVKLNRLKMACGGGSGGHC